MAIINYYSTMADVTRYYQDGGTGPVGSTGSVGSTSSVGSVGSISSVGSTGSVGATGSTTSNDPLYYGMSDYTWIITQNGAMVVPNWLLDAEDAIDYGSNSLIGLGSAATSEIVTALGMYAAGKNNSIGFYSALYSWQGLKGIGKTNMAFGGAATAIDIAQGNYLDAAISAMGCCGVYGAAAAIAAQLAMKNASACQDAINKGTSPSTALSIYWGTGSGGVPISFVYKKYDK